MKRPAIFLVCALVATASFADVHGAWTATSESPGKFHLFMTTGGWRNFGRTITAGELGIDDAAANGQTAVPVTMKLARDAGTIVMEGTFKNGDGAGQFTFVPNREFFSSLREMGVTVDLSEHRSEDDELLNLAFIDLTRSYVRMLHGLYRDATFREIRKARAVGVTPEYVNELAAAGYKNLPLRDLTRLAATGVDARFIQQMSKFKE